MSAVHISGLTESEAEGIQSFEKPAPGSWTEAFGLDTGPVSFKDSYYPEFYELEKEAVFRRSWLQLGRVEEVPRPGSYFTRELNFLGVSVLVVRGMDNEIRAFHNVCSHRGNKLVWDEHPSKEAKGTCRMLSCKYHGWRYELDGKIGYVHNAQEFFGLDAEKLALPKIHLEVWAGFIFVNLEKEPRQSLSQFLTPTVAKLDSYPFHKMTQRYVFEAEIKSNWKLFMDAFQEVYHNPFVHGKLNDPNLPQTGVDKIPTMVPYFAEYGKHRLFTSGGPHANAKVRKGRPADTLFGATFYGPLDVPDVGPLGDALNPGGIENWGLDSWKIYPNFDIINWGRNWFITYQYWPTNVNTNRFVWTVNFVPPRNAKERLAQEHCLITTREFLIQDANTLEATQQMVASGARDDYYLGDQEVAVRHFHKVIQDDVEAYRGELESQGGRK
jgi:phenylpropionate dioxygenase-like ring-hydroxylating dioxygenase large terminal subunit